MKAESLSRNVLIAALEKSSNLVAAPPSGEGAGVEEGARAIAETVALIEDATAKIAANDFSGVEALFARQALALDVVFNQHAKQSARYWDRINQPIYDNMRVALRAQAQCRSTLESLIAMKTKQAHDAGLCAGVSTPRVPAMFGEQTVEKANLRS